MPHAAVDNVRLRHARLQSLQASFNLRDHALVNDTLAHQLATARGIQAANERLFVRAVEKDARRVGKQHEFLGFQLSGDGLVKLSVSDGVMIPARRLVADAPGRRESILYWSRLGEYLPTSDNEQHMDRLKAAMHGYVADGLLVRFSAVGQDAAASLASMEAFIPAFVRAVSPGNRRVFIGTRYASALAAAGV